MERNIKNFICSSRKVMFETDKESNLHGPPHFTVLFCCLWLPIALSEVDQMKWLQASGFHSNGGRSLAVRISHAH